MARLSRGNFNKVWLDYTIKSTENKALKGLGGIIGLTLKGCALERWFLSRPVVSAQYSQNFDISFLKSSDGNQQHQRHSDSRPAAQRNWTNDVNSN